MQAARREVAKTFEDDTHNLMVKDIGWIWVERDLPTTNRLVNQTAMVCVSKERDQDGKFVSVFTKGALWIRGGVAENVPVLQPINYVNPLAAGVMSCAALQGQYMKPSAEMKQHVSGPAMYKQAASLAQSSRSTTGSRQYVRVVLHFATACMA